MTDDDEPKKPPRASWEPPEPEPIPTRRQRAAQKPPRASWEPPDPDETSRPVAVPAPSEPVAASAPSEPGAVSTPSEVAAATETAPVEAPAVSGTYETSVPTTVSGAYDLPSAPTEMPAPPIEVAAPAPATTLATTDDPLAPLPTSDTDLRIATTKPAPERKRRRPPSDADLTRDDDDDDKPGGGSRKLVLVSAVSLVVGLGIAALVLLGNMNKGRYVIQCEPDEVVAARGRGFPPWGTRPLDDAQWKPMKIPPQAECRERETEDEDELSRWYFEMLVTRAGTLLQGREVTKIDEAAGLLEQALLHTRSPDRRDARANIERMLGDVQYWRASAKLRDAASALTEAAKQFDGAAEQVPRYVTDASAWATHVRRLVDELRAGPGGDKAPFPPVPPTDHADRPPAPPGVALPIEPAAGSASGGGSDAAPSAPPDAGLPTGGVLL